MMPQYLKDFEKSLKPAKQLALMSLILTMSGCASLKGTTNAYNDCLIDPSCNAKIQEAVTATSTLSGAVSTLAGYPINLPIGVMVSSIAAVIAGIYFGRKKKTP